MDNEMQVRLCSNLWGGVMMNPSGEVYGACTLNPEPRHSLRVQGLGVEGLGTPRVHTRAAHRTLLGVPAQNFVGLIFLF